LWHHLPYKLDSPAREPDRQRELLSKNLAKVSSEPGRNRDGPVNQFLTVSLSRREAFSSFFHWTRVRTAGKLRG
jgi:hypothetical protein